MSHKIAKRVRKLLKSEGIDVTHAVYTRDEVGANVLVDNCGRKLYQESKKFAKRGE